MSWAAYNAKRKSGDTGASAAKTAAYGGHGQGVHPATGSPMTLIPTAPRQPISSGSPGYTVVRDSKGNVTGLNTSNWADSGGEKH